MTENRATESSRDSSRSAEVSLFLRRWVAHPFRVAAVLPSSDAFCSLVARHAVRSPDEIVVEVGAGTGAISQALITAGLPQSNLLMIELDDEMSRMLQARFPGANVVLGDAKAPAEVIPQDWHGRITTCVSGLPLLQFPLAEQRRFVDQLFDTMGPGGRLLQYSNMPVPPLPKNRLSLDATRLSTTWNGPMPGFVWQFTRAGDSAADGGSH